MKSRQVRFINLLTIITLLGLLGWGNIPPVSADASSEKALGGPTILYVAHTGKDTNTCTSAATACRTITGALNKANTGATIKVAIGTYIYMPVNATQNAVIVIKKSVTLLGGWNASFTTQTGLSTINGQASHMGVWIGASAATVVIERFAIKNGTRGIYNFSNDLTVNKSAIIDNHGVEGGGIYNTAIMTINNSTIRGNSASKHGGGLKSGNWRTTATTFINNSTISENSAGTGGGIWVAYAVLLNNSTVSGNTATSGGGLQGGDISLYNTIVAGNIANGGTGPDCVGARKLYSYGYNIFGNISNCPLTPTTGDLLNTDPKLGPFTGGYRGYYPLLADSPAINAGNPATPGSSQYACLRRDQRNVYRPQESACDIGAYEYVAP